MEREVEEVREYFSSGKTRDVRWRRSQLNGLLKFLEEKEDSLFRAFKQDLGKHPVEAYRDEIGVVIKEINAALHNLKNWMSAKKLKLPAYAFPSRAELVPQPLGIVLVISSWNFPLGLSLLPLVAAIAAGNTAVLKPSELSPAVSSLLAEGLNTYLDSNAVKIFQGGPTVSQRLLQLKWDHIFFTGSRRVGSIVMTEAAKHLTPVTLELGGKCPTVIDNLDKFSNRERTMALKRVLAAKFGTCNGQACLSVDYILVEEKYAPNLVELLKELTNKMFGDNLEELANTSSRIVNRQHFMRLKRLLDEPGVRASLVFGGSMDEEGVFMGPTILVDPPLNSEIMTEEIFGPLLPIVTLKKIEESVEFINARPRPLAIYCFTKNGKLKKRLQSETLSGALVFNDTVVQYAAETIPFGGVGESGFGRYHGKFGFDTLSHEKAILKRNYLIDFWFRYPPWRGYQMEMFRGVYNYDYVRMVLTILGLKKPPPLPSI